MREVCGERQTKRNPAFSRRVKKKNRDMTYNPESAEAQHDDHHLINNDFELQPPAWFERHHQKPHVDDVVDDDDDWFDFADAPNPIIWSGRTWRLSVRGIEKIDGSYVIVFGDIWSPNVVKGAITIEPNDLDELREALRVARLIDSYWGDQS
jgi:hypothetical protein